MKSRIAPLAIAVVLAGAGLLWAQTTPPAQHPMPAMEQHPGGMMAGNLADECKGMMEKHQAMTDQAKAMDAKLDSLVTAMNQARGSKKVDAEAAALTELVAQRKAMRAAMESMQPMMMEHMMKHMQMGMMQGMASSMAACPMMGGAQAEGSDHEKHH